MISVVIIANNEEKNIGRCLESVKGVAKEIIVLDSGSTDRTREIVEEAGGKWIPQEWLGYGAQKNKAISLAQYPYILSLDADEALSEELRKSILTLGSSLSGAYQVSRLTNYAGTWIRHSGWYPDRKVRLFHRDQARWDDARVHEKLMVEAAVSVRKLRGDLLHYSYYSVEEHRHRTEVYSRLQAETLLEAGLVPGIWHLSVKPAYTFFKRFLLQAGWKDGKAGFTIARISAWGVRRRYEILREMRT